MLHHNNAPAQFLLHATVFGLKFNDIASLYPYSLDLIPCDFKLILKMKIKVQGCRFNILEEIQRKLRAALDIFIESDF